jgi:hypothetical protein
MQVHGTAISTTFSRSSPFEQAREARRRRGGVQPVFMDAAIVSAIYFRSAPGMGDPGMRRRVVFRAVLATFRTGGLRSLAAAVVLAVTCAPAVADGCAVSCRSQHNNCRMAAKLLYSQTCDAQLQNCISQCFSENRFNREGRAGRGPGEFRERRGQGEFGGGPPEMRRPSEGGPGGAMREFRGERGPRFLGGRGLF